MEEDATNNEKWAQGDSFFNGKSPFSYVNPLEKLDLSSLHNYVQNAISRVSMGEPALISEVFETHQYAIAKIKISKKLYSNQLRVFVNYNQIKLEGLTGYKAQIINLPCHVEASNCKAIYRQGILEIKLPKVKYKNYYHEVFIH